MNRSYCFIIHSYFLHEKSWRKIRSNEMLFNLKDDLSCNVIGLFIFCSKELDKNIMQITETTLIAIGHKIIKLLITQKQTQSFYSNILLKIYMGH